MHLPFLMHASYQTRAPSVVSAEAPMAPSWDAFSWRGHTDVDAESSAFGAAASTREAMRILSNSRAKLDFPFAVPTARPVTQRQAVKSTREQIIVVGAQVSAACGIRTALVRSVGQSDLAEPSRSVGVMRFGI